MIAEKEKAQLAVEIMEKFAPYMDNSAEQYHKMGLMISQFGLLVESLSELPEEKKKIFLDYIRVFNSYIEHAGANYNDLRNFYSFMTLTTNTLISQFKNAMGIE
jgi:hypothetical protein